MITHRHGAQGTRAALDACCDLLELVDRQLTRHSFMRLFCLSVILRC